MRSVRIEDPERIGDYAVLGRLGHGAMGVVYLARSPGGRTVAIKVVRPWFADDPRFRERFRREVATARAVGGFWTAAVVDADPDAPAPWLATEYVPGPTLRDVVEEHGPLPVPALRALVAGLAEALSAIHAAGLVHRDLKPSNVLLAPDGPRVIDFGIAKAREDAALTATGVMVGTPGFLSPEQVEGGAVTPASDVFALGLVLVYAATGRGPYGAGDVAALLYRAVHTQPDLSGVAPELRALAARCLRATPHERPTPADVLAEVGTPVTSGWLPEPVRAMAERRGIEAIRPDVGTEALPAGAAARAAGPLTRQYTVAGGPPSGWLPAVRSPAASPGTGGAVFARSRHAVVRRSVATTAVALVCLGASGGASESGYRGAALGFFVGFALLVARAAWLLWHATSPYSVVVSGAGLAVTAGTRRLSLPWSVLARVRVVENRRRPWLVVWPAGEAASAMCRNAGCRGHHGGFRVFPVGHERRGRARSGEVRELRAALDWYAATAHDPGSAERAQRVR